MDKLMVIFLLFSFLLTLECTEVSSPDKLLLLKFNLANGLATYSVDYDGKNMLINSRLGLKSNIGDFSEGLSLISISISKETRSYDMTRTKVSHSDFNANILEIILENKEKHNIIITFLVSNNNIAFRYTLQRQENGNPKSAVITSEVTSFLFPNGTTTFISPDSESMVGWERTKPSYEEVYSADAEMGCLYMKLPL